MQHGREGEGEGREVGVGLMERNAYFLINMVMESIHQQSNIPC